MTYTDLMFSLEQDGVEQGALKLNGCEGASNVFEKKAVFACGRTNTNTGMDVASIDALKKALQELLDQL